MLRVLLTGANRGLGLEFARQLLARGERVIATARKPALAHELNKLAFAHPGRLTILPLDVAKPASIAGLVGELALVTDGLDVLINNAGVLPAGEAWGELDAKRLGDAFATNAAGALLLTQAATPLLERGATARVLNISSNLGSLTLRDGFYTPSYCISKAALNMATRLLAFALIDRGITVACAHPGWVKTDMGGPNAGIAPAEAVCGLLGLLDRLTPAYSGRFLGCDGAEVPW